MGWASACDSAGTGVLQPPSGRDHAPGKASFESLNEYFATAFHECVHATEYPSRLDWSRKNKDNSYALGELIAELGGIFVCRELDVPASDDLSNHTTYLASQRLSAAPVLTFQITFLPQKFPRNCHKIDVS